MRHFILLITIVLIGLNVKAQQRGIVSNFMINDYYYSPAIAGSKPFHSASVSYRNQWVGFADAPSLIMGNFNGSVKNRQKAGYGVTVLSEKAGLTNTTAVYLNYVQHFKLSENIRLGLGIQPGLMQYRIKLYDAILADEGDAVLTGNVYSANAVDVSAGFNLYSEKFFIMASAHHLLGKQIQFTSYNSNLDFHYNAIAGYNFKFKKKKVEIQPSVLFKYTKPVPFQITGMLKTTFQGKYWFGLLYRTDDAVGLSLGAQIKKRFNLAYGYDYSIGPIRKYQSGSHEVTLSFIITKEKPSLEEEDEELNKSILEQMQKEVDQNNENEKTKED